MLLSSPTVRCKISAALLENTAFSTWLKSEFEAYCLQYSLLDKTVVLFCSFNLLKPAETQQMFSCISDLLKEEATVMMKREHHDPRSNVNLKNARRSKRSFGFSVFVFVSKVFLKYAFRTYFCHSLSHI